MALDKVTEISPPLHPSTRPRSNLSDLERISAETRELIRNGAASKNATAAQKFALGDEVTGLLALLSLAEVNAILTKDSRAFLELCRNRLDELLNGHPVSRGTLVNYGKISRVFGSDHDIRRGSLPFSFAKTLSSLENVSEREYWYEQALLRKMSVSDLQAELSSRRGRDSGITNRRKQSKAFVCAQTGQAITEDDLKTMVVIYPPTSVNSTVQEPVKRRGKGKAATEASASPKAAPLKAAPPKPLRFRDLAALAAWSEAHKREYPEAGSIPALPVSTRSEERTMDSEQHAADAHADAVDSSFVEDPQEVLSLK